MVKVIFIIIVVFGYPLATQNKIKYYLCKQRKIKTNKLWQQRKK